jgi:hypothetical protein
MEPACGRPEALAQTEIVLRILSRLYPQWREENETDAYFEFSAQRDAAAKLIARLDGAAEIDAMPGGDASPSITAASLHPLIWKSAQAQWSTGHHHEAVHATGGNKLDAPVEGQPTRRIRDGSRSPIVQRQGARGRKAAAAVR